MISKLRSLYTLNVCCLGCCDSTCTMYAVLMCKLQSVMDRQVVQKLIDARNSQCG